MIIELCQSCELVLEVDGLIAQKESKIKCSSQPPLLLLSIHKFL